MKDCDGLRPSRDGKRSNACGLGNRGSADLDDRCRGLVRAAVGDGVAAFAMFAQRRDVEIAAIDPKLTWFGYSVVTAYSPSS